MIGDVGYDGWFVLYYYHYLFFFFRLRFLVLPNTTGLVTNISLLFPFFTLFFFLLVVSHIPHTHHRRCCFPCCELLGDEERGLEIRREVGECIVVGGELVRTYACMYAVVVDS